jgi:hypothetical protein
VKYRDKGKGAALGPDGLQRVGPDRVGRIGVGPLGSAQKGRKVLFFLKLFSSAKQIQEKPRKCLKARKIPRKFEKFQENP